ncbi:hypothetical protein RC083_12135 [Pseudoalteromonas haloplanktis]|uniref:Cycloisomerase n=1 Tax=Pseudoalteromonas haloplanktis TaxID=228 RepID=A0ABU1BD73_PSEHA|nr:hypothetical protein [Pseudoalteromonas haloplanktis]MDQ9092336.1 hypothetical protein [Pseudoalteromonas haloplanktis]
MKIIAYFSLVTLSISLMGFAFIPTVKAEPKNYKATLLAEYSTFDARQGVAVDDQYFYAANNFRITKHDKKTGKALLQWDGKNSEIGPLIHLDSLMEWNGKLYGAHSNYPHTPMLSSVEIWDSSTMEHIGNHSFGRSLGSFTWLDRHAGFWWGGFGNYDKVQKGETTAYGKTSNTAVVKMNDKFEIIEQWSLPPGILQKMTPMSNSGGSFSDDGYLYITGHDHEEIYVVEIPKFGSQLIWLATIETPGIEGQGIAWDRTEKQRVLWGLIKQDRHIKKYLIPHIQIDHSLRKNGVVNTPNNFSKN